MKEPHYDMGTTPFRERVRIACAWQFTRKSAKYYYGKIPGHLLEVLVNNLKSIFEGLVSLLSLALFPVAIVWLPIWYFLSPFWCAIREPREYVWRQLRNVVDNSEKRKNFQPVHWSAK